MPKNEKLIKSLTKLLKNTEAQIRSDMFAKSFQENNPGLRSYFERVLEGNGVDYRTPFGRVNGKDVPVDEIIEDWSHTLVSIQDKYPSLYEFEEGLKAKVGPMSIMKPLAERLGDIASYYQGILSPGVAVSDESIREVIKEFTPIRGTRPRSQWNTWKSMKKSTNSGSPYFTKRSSAVLSTIPCDVRMTWGEDNLTEVEQIFHNDEYWNACAILGWRGQEGGPSEDDVKQRVVFMFPMAVNVLELSVYQPLIAGVQQHNLIPAYVSMDAVDLGITKLFDTKSSDDLVVCTDFSKFDQHFGEHLIDAAGYTISELVDFNYDWLQVVYPIKYEIPLCLQPDIMIYGPHGMGSGSGGTNFDETLAHRCLQYEAALGNGRQLNIHSQCLGDDGILSYPGINIDDVVNSYTSHGLDMNIDKQYASTEDCTYLRRWHSQKYRVNGVCVGVYSTYRALNRLARQERFYDADKWNKELVTLRYLSIIENCKFHPLFKEFVEFCMKRDKYRLGLDIPGFFTNLDKLVSESMDQLPDFLGYVQSSQLVQKGISQWEVVKYLKSLA